MTAPSFPLSNVEEDRHVMKRLCDERSLPLFYYETALGLWMRLKKAYACQCYVHAPARYMLLCLHITVKNAGPAWTTFQHCLLSKVKKEWPYVTSAELRQEEIKMCTLVNWDMA